MIELLHNNIIPGVDYMAAESSERKKISTLYILEILKRYTDDTYDSEGRPLHCLTQAQIGEKLYADYGINLDRKAVSRALPSLIVLVAADSIRLIIERSVCRSSV